LGSSNWEAKSRAARAVKALAEGAGEATGPHLPQLMTALLSELPGRIWDGKEAVLMAIGEEIVRIISLNML
jgi:proteasome component ECM29